MDLFDEQIRQSRQNDQEMFEDSLYRMALAVMGKDPDNTEDERVISKVAIDEILRYYHFKPAAIPDFIKNTDEQWEYCLRPHGIMHRKVNLTEEWYKDCYGPILAFYKDTGTPIALLPRASFGYSYYDRESGRKKKVDKKFAALIDEEAVSFYRPLPQKKLNTLDLVLFMKQSMSRADTAIMVILTLLIILAGMIIPAVSKFLTGYVLETGNSMAFAGAVALLLCTLISSAAFTAVKNLTVTRIRIKTSVPLEAAVMARMINLPNAFFRDFSVGELYGRFQAIGQLCSHMIDYYFTVILAPAFSLLYIGQIFYYAPALAVPALIVLGVITALSVLYITRYMKVSECIMESEFQNSALTYSMISGIQKIKLSGSEKRAFSRWGNSYAVQIDNKYNIPIFLKIFYALITAVYLLGTVVFYYLAAETNISPSSYIAFNAAYGTALAAFITFSDSARSAAQINPILNMVKPILNAVPESSDRRETVTTVLGGIELSNVYFRYKENGPYVIDGINLRIKPGENIGIVGGTGSGKTTLLRLLLGFETPEKGTIYYDRKDMSKLDHRFLRRRIGVVMQDGSLFSGDIYSNIVISAPQLSIDDAWEAAEIAGIAEDIRNMPMGMHTYVSEGQGGISGGQKQRIMIARAVAPKPKILMFDEATSALDNKTQKKVSDALDKMKCTRIIIAHRLSTIKNCDRILVLDKGRIEESGTYEELIAKNGIFAKLFERQRLD